MRACSQAAWEEGNAHLRANQQDHGDLEGAKLSYGRALALSETLAPESLAVASVLGSLGRLALDRRQIDPSTIARWQTGSTGWR